MPFPSTEHKILSRIKVNFKKFQNKIVKHSVAHSLTRESGISKGFFMSLKLALSLPHPFHLPNPLLANTTAKMVHIPILYMLQAKDFPTLVGRGNERQKKAVLWIQMRIGRIRSIFLDPDPDRDRHPEHADPDSADSDRYHCQAYEKVYKLYFFPQYFNMLSIILKIMI
jgi:hypothetical protein